MRAKKSRDYGLAEAKAHLSEVVARAEREGPQRILVRGRPAAMVVSAKDWEQHRQPAGSFLDWLKSTGVYGIGVELEEPPKHFSEPPDFDKP